MKKTMLVLFVVIMLVTTACAPTSPSGTTAKTPTQAPSQTTPAEQTDDKTNLLDKPIVFKVGLAESASTPLVTYSAKAYERITEATNGDLVFEIFPDGQLGTITDVMEQSLTGAPIICNTGWDALGDYVPELLAVAFPYTFLSLDEIFKFLESDYLANLEVKMNEANIALIGGGTAGYRHFISSKPIYDASSIKGMNVRMGPSTLAQTYISVMGGTPHSSNWVDNYTMIQQGIFEACEAPLSLLYSSSLYEVCDYLTLSGHFANPYVQVMSYEMWQKIPEPYQKLIREIFMEEAKNCYDVVIEQEDELIQQFKEKGIEVIETDKSTFAEFVPALYEAMGIDQGLYEEVRAAIEGR